MPCSESRTTTTVTEPTPRRSSERFDRIPRPGPRADQRRDDQGKEALYSTSPSSAPSAQVEVSCARCGVQTGLSLAGAVRVAASPAVWDPFRDRVRARCPACDQRAWLTVRAGQGLRVLLRRRASE